MSAAYIHLPIWSRENVLAKVKPNLRVSSWCVCSVFPRINATVICRRDGYVVCAHHLHVPSSYHVDHISKYDVFLVSTFAGSM